VIQVDERTGEISLRPGQTLDREAASKLHILAIPVDGTEPIGIQIDVLDENDNSPMFPVDSVQVAKPSLISFVNIMNSVGHFGICAD
jgi:hypothetical protein